MTDIDELLTERKKAHGEYTDHARVTQNLKAMMRDSLNYKESRLSSIQMESLDMIVHKIGRIVSGDPNHQDHWDDIAGYAKLVSQRLK